MTGIALAAHLGAGPIHPDLERQARAVLARFVARADDGTSVWNGTSASLGHAWHATTPEDLARGPGVAERGPLRLLADARIDNRDEVIDALGLAKGTPDPEVLLAAWEKWESASVEHVIGDYAFAVWNDATREVALVRDAMGMRPLYFVRRDRLVVAASEIHALAAGPLATSLELDPEQATRFMVDRYSETAATLFKGVETVSPGGVVVLAERGVTRRQVWYPDPFRRTPTDDLETNRQVLHEVLSRAIVARMRSVDDPSFLVSGGVDSSVVTCLAHRLVPPRAPRLLLHMSQRGHPGDETDHFERIRRSVGGLGLVADPRTYVREIGPDSALIAPGELYDLTGTMNAPLFARLPANRRSVVITGLGSDDILQESGSECATHLANQRYRQAWASAQRMAPEQGGLLPYTARQLAHYLLPSTIMHTLRDLRPSRFVWPDWLEPLARRRLDGWHRSEVRANAGVASPDPIQRGIALLFRGAFDIHLLLSRYDFMARHGGVDARHPFYDRRVVETLMALPHALRFDGLLPKPILRAVGEGVVPPANLARTDSAHFSGFIESAREGPHRAAWVAGLAAPEVERLGIARPGSLRRLLASQPHDRVLSRAMALEVAIRTLRQPTQPTGNELRRRARIVGGLPHPGALQSGLAAEIPTRQGTCDD